MSVDTFRYRKSQIFSSTNYFNYPSSVDSASEIKSLRVQNAILKNANAVWEAQMELVVGHPQKITYLRDIPMSQAKDEILKLIKNKDKVYYSEISDQLKLDIELVVNACEELEREGMIEGAE